MNKSISHIFLAVISFLTVFITACPSLAQGFRFNAEVAKRTPEENAIRKAFSVCPPFFLRDESGDVIDPVHGMNADRPYSPEKTCGACHPGGCPLETDRNDHRYDRWMKERGLEPGGENGLDGDYFKAMWSKTGVIEADCLICHMPGYRYKARKAQIKSLNFRWAATV